MATATPKSPGTKIGRLTRRKIDRYAKLLDRKHELESQARALGKEAEEIGTKIHAYVEAECKRKVGVVIHSCGYALCLAVAGVYPAWKQAYIDALGEKAAARVTAATPPTLRLELVKE